MSTMSNGLIQHKAKHLNHHLHNCKPLWNVLNSSQEIATRKWPKINTTHLCDLLPTATRWWHHFRSKFKDYTGLWRWMLKVLTLALPIIFQKRSFYDGEVGCGSGGMNAMCSRPEVADDVISGTDVGTFRCYAYFNLRVAIFSSFRENLNQPFM